MAPKTAAPKSGAFERVRMEPLPEHLYEEITAEQLVIDIAALTDLTEDEVRQTGVQNTLVALHLAGNVPEHRQDLQRLAQGETMIRPSGPPVENATGPECLNKWHCRACTCRYTNTGSVAWACLVDCSECSCAECTGTCCSRTEWAGCGSECGSLGSPEFDE